MDIEALQKVFIQVISSELNKAPLNDILKQQLTPDFISNLFIISKKHDLAHIVSAVLYKNGLPSDENSASRFSKEEYMAVYRYEQMNYELIRLTSALEDFGVPFMPLKGSVIRKFYDKPLMRTSCDIDILVKKHDAQRVADYLVEKYNYTQVTHSFHDISLFSHANVHIELHFTLIEDGIANQAAEILDSVWDTAALCDGYSCCYEMTDELFYFYHIAHMAKHFITGGCGIKPFIDLWILDNLNTSNQKKRDELLAKGGLTVFAEATQKLSKAWFDDAPMDETSRKMQAFILQGGVYGTSENRVLLQQNKKGGKFGYILYRMFIPYSKLKSYYPILEKHRWLFPFMQIRRWGLLFNSSVAEMAKNEIVANNKASKDNAEAMKDLMTEIGLK